MVLLLVTGGHIPPHPDYERAAPRLTRTPTKPIGGRISGAIGASPDNNANATAAAVVWEDPGRAAGGLSVPVNRQLTSALVVVAAVGLGLGLLVSRPAPAGPIRADSVDGGESATVAWRRWPAHDAVRLNNRGRVAATVDSIKLAPGSHGVTLVEAIAASPLVTPGDDFAAAERVGGGLVQRIPGAIVPPVSSSSRASYWSEVFVTLQFASGPGPFSTNGYTISYRVGNTHYRTTASAGRAVFCMTGSPPDCR